MDSTKIVKSIHQMILSAVAIADPFLDQEIKKEYEKTYDGNAKIIIEELESINTALAKKQTALVRKFR